MIKISSLFGLSKGTFSGANGMKVLQQRATACLLLYFLCNLKVKTSIGIELEYTWGFEWFETRPAFTDLYWSVWLSQHWPLDKSGLIWAPDYSNLVRLLRLNGTELLADILSPHGTNSTLTTTTRQGRDSNPGQHRRTHITAQQECMIYKLKLTGCSDFLLYVG